MLLGVIEPAHQVDVRLAAPVAVHAIDEGLSVAGRAAGIDHHDDVAVRGKQLRIPAVAPAVAPRALRAAVDQELHRILLARVEVRRADEEALDFDVADGGEPEGFHLRKVELGEESSR